MAQTRSYITPIDSAGAALVSAGHGRFTLTAGATFFFVFGRTSAVNQSVTLTGLTSTASPNGPIITSATIQGTDHSELDFTNFDATPGIWVSDDPTFGFFAVADGAGWSASNCVVAATGAGVGGARWNLSLDGAARTRLAVVVGATGGDVIVSAVAKGL